MAASNFLSDSLNLYQAYDGGNQLGDAMLQPDFFDRLTASYSLAATLLSPTPFGVGANLSAASIDVIGNWFSYTFGTAAAVNNCDGGSGFYNCAGRRQVP